MKVPILAAITLLGVSAGLDAQEVSETLGPRQHVSAYFGPAAGYRVTIVSEKGVVSVLEVPSGVFLNVVGAAEPRIEGDGARRRFHGDVTIRTRRADELAPEESRRAREIMARAPLEITLQNVTVSVDALGEQGG